MNSNPITVVINGATYRVSANDSSAIRNIPEADRAELIALLEAVQIQDRASRAAIQSAAAGAATSTSPGQPQLTGDPDRHIPRAERLGSGEVDALMAKLIMEEKRDRKPGLTKQGIYKVVAVFAAIVLLFVVLG